MRYSINYVILFIIGEILMELKKKKNNIQNGTISELYTDDKKSKYFSEPIDKSAKNFNEKLCTKEITVQNCHC